MVHRAKVARLSNLRDTLFSEHVSSLGSWQATHAEMLKNRTELPSHLMETVEAMGSIASTLDQPLRGAVNGVA